MIVSDNAGVDKPTKAAATSTWGKVEAAAAAAAPEVSAVAQREAESEPAKGVEWAPMLGTAAAITAATVMQAAEMAAVALINRPPSGDEVAGCSHDGVAEQRETEAAEDEARRRWLAHMIVSDDPGHVRSPGNSLGHDIPKRASVWGKATAAAAAAAAEASNMEASIQASAEPKAYTEWAPGLDKAAAVTAATVMQVAEMTAVAVLKVSGKSARE
jgi:hypothetical protein